MRKKNPMLLDTMDESECKRKSDRARENCAHAVEKYFEL